MYVYSCCVASGDAKNLVVHLQKEQLEDHAGWLVGSIPPPPMYLSLPVSPSLAPLQPTLPLLALSEWAMGAAEKWLDP